MNVIQKLITYVLILGGMHGVAGALPTWNSIDFSQSFVRHYEFNPEGRYVHEYHPFILNKTTQSFKKLEATLRGKGLNLVGRNIILGYEENAIPNYYTDFRRSKIQDEASLKNRVGWSLRLHNRFGFMTGFLFKDCESLARNDRALFTHINATTVPIFDDRAYIFQEHAFGQAVDLVFKARGCIMNSISAGNVKDVFTWLIRFWQALYQDAFKVSNDQVAGTQDILFSIDYAKYLSSSQLPLFNFFVGPDITYPIEVFAKQDRDVTRNAQSFVRRFVKELKPRQDKKTAYIFCSFVDGVGKSTMLGNIKNWMKFGDNIDDFDHVDNSSSQLAEIFEFKKDVYIVDLPAQISHFTYKPDGLVFVDVLTRFDHQTGIDLLQYAQKNEQVIEQNYQRLVTQVQDIIAQEGYFASDFSTAANADQAFIRNLYLLNKVEDNVWRPFKKDGRDYLVNTSSFREVRYLTPLAEVTSEGLKNIESEQMMFFEGVRFPLSYDIFLDDLTTKLKDNGVDNIVFVDFASMYPRSCRENIRINYLVQQIALLDKNFRVQNSPYKDFVSGGELLHLIRDSKYQNNLFNAFKLETLVRQILCDIILDQDNAHLDGVTVAQVTEMLRKQLSIMPQEMSTVLDKMMKDKLAVEAKNLEKLYGLSKSYINVQQLAWRNVAKYSDLLQNICGYKLANTEINNLWEDFGYLSSTQTPYGEPAPSSNGSLMRMLHSFDILCKDDFAISSAVRMLRASWYAALANLLFATGDHEDSLSLKKVKYKVPSLFACVGKDAQVRLAQRWLEPYEEEVSRELLRRDSMFYTSIKNKEFGVYNGSIYRVNWESRATSKGLFAYSSTVVRGRGMRGYAPVITRLVQKYQQETSSQTVMPTSELYEKLQDSVYWGIQRKSMKRQAIRNGLLNLDTLGEDQQQETKKKTTSKQVKIYIANKEQYPAIRFVVRMLATLEMILKDTDANVVVRYGDREDFKACIKMLECITLPKYFGLYLPTDLFDNYDTVEPYPSWDSWGC